MSNGRVLGWDIGGANVKAALAAGESLVVASRPYSIWENPKGLCGVLSEIAAELGPAEAVGVTMTAELADCFPTKKEGVAFVLDALQATFPRTPIQVFTVDGVFCSVAEAQRAPLAVASANWAATARFLAVGGHEALLVDAGTTTTDIIPIAGGEVAALGRTDPERLTSGELVYTGAVRTPLCAIAHTVPFRGHRCRVAAELFAQAADVHLWLGKLAERDYTGRTPDGRGKSRAESGARLARLVCADPTLVAEQEITQIAEHLAERQARLIAAAIFQVRSWLGSKAPRTVLGAGLGSFLAAAAARRAHLVYRPLADQFGDAASRALPAVAVARLLSGAR